MSVRGRSSGNRGKKPFRNYGGSQKRSNFSRSEEPSFDNEHCKVRDIISEYTKFDFLQSTSFSEYPLSDKTLGGLDESGFQEPTDIQRQTIGLALRGLDILGAAKTGSGKTLAFVIPLLELLWRHKWSPHVDGLGALVITPTRELAYQIFEVLRNVGRNHDFSAALLVGGNHVGFERARIGGMNIVVGTPGRLLQHMDTSADFDTSHMKLLVLDEADRCLDMGFERQLNAIIENLPKERQTLLFSATQTKSVRDLARLSLHDPVYVSAHEKSTHSTPDNLVQNYVVCTEDEKVNFLFSFLRSHIGRKVMVFMTSCRQVRFMSEAFVKLRSGVKVLCLHGKVNPSKRTKVYKSFCLQSNVALFATDVAARGLDFPDVDWVVQMDCASDADEYIHRVGRTARYANSGRALLVLTPSQKEPMLEQLAAKRIPICAIRPNRRKMFNASVKLQSILAQDANLKAFAQRCVVSYMKSVCMMSNKAVFDPTKVDIEAYSQFVFLSSALDDILMRKSLGLLHAPRVRFLRKQQQSGGGAAQNQSKLNAVAPRSFAVTAVLQSDSDDDPDGGDSLFTLKKRDLGEAVEMDEEQAPEATQIDDINEKSINKTLTKRAVAKKVLRQYKKLPTVVQNKIVFSDSDEEINIAETSHHDDKTGGQSESIDPVEKPESDSAPFGGIDLEQSKRQLAAVDLDDKMTHRQRMKAIRREKKLKLKRQLKMEKESRSKQARLGSASDDSDSGPDLSWLPDPDKKKNDQRQQDESEHSDNDVDEKRHALNTREQLARKLLGI